MPATTWSSARAVSWPLLSYAFLPIKADPDAEDFGEASRLLQVQLDKNAGVCT